MEQSIKNTDTSKLTKADMEALVKSARDGNSESMEIILNKFNYFIIKHAGKYIVPSHDFDDLIQHGFLSIIKAVYLYKLGSNNFTTYCTNAIINNYKALLKGHIKHFREIQNEAILSLQVYDFTLEDEVIAYDETKRIMEALNKLPDEEKNIIIGVYLQHRPLTEVAATLKISYRQAVEIKKKALHKLRQAANRK
ncbi:sigma-70 family RNA polymerase sigma factor [Clostridium pasteurianum]|uniref:RNA polymerase sigma factor, sigma-70 family n=1 Tax=Clostridium pasteurianum BC1 TaxID=86416 RepID=R4K2E9_CLOPA|nr:sigma-70 family RNA polymerase sigma factor [Clostridium pasteurianum]AGK95916.1 RNA polymerase sigma factor, sigma-70 family [Clostridium pasteurianum BC1]